MPSHFTYPQQSRQYKQGHIRLQNSVFFPYLEDANLRKCNPHAAWYSHRFYTYWKPFFPILPLPSPPLLLMFARNMTVLQII